MRPGIWIAGLMFMASLVMAPTGASAMDGIGHGGGGGGGSSLVPTDGEAYADVLTAIADGGRLIRDVVLGRSHEDSEEGVTLWGEGYGAQDDYDADGTAAAASDNTTGGVGGIDFVGPNGWRFGVAGGASDGDFDVAARMSSAGLDGRQLAIYADGPVGGLVFRGGAAWTWTDVDMRRSDPASTYRANAKAKTGQAFAELGYRRRWNVLELEPYVGVGWMKTDIDSFTETGGPTPLVAAANSFDTGYTDVGLRAAWPGFALKPFVDLAWRHGFGDEAPTTALSSAGLPVGSVSGLSLPQDAAVAKVGASLALGEHASLRLEYGGVFGDGVNDQAFGATFDWRF